MYRIRGWRRRIQVILFVCLLCLSSGAAIAQTIVLDRGYLDMDPRTGRLVLGGSRGFAFIGNVSAGSGVFRPLDCNDDPLNCLPGTSLSLRAYWNGLDLPGFATLDGVIHPRVGSDPAMMSLELTGELTLPPLAPSATVSSAVSITGGFNAGTNEVLAGSGIATVHLVPDPVYPGSWRVSRVLYDLGPVMSAPWQSADVGDVRRVGSAVQATEDTFVAAGAGRDIWGTADAFQFVYRRFHLSGSISARVMTETSTNPFAKAGVMFRESLAPEAATVLLNMTPGGIIEMMSRPASGEPMTFVAAAAAAPEGTWLRLLRVGHEVSGWYATSPGAWRRVGTVATTMNASPLAGLALNSHDDGVLNRAVFADVQVSDTALPANLISGGDFEGYVPPSLGPPGWIADTPFRQVPAKSETHQPRSGRQNGACWTPDYQDCGMYQDLVAPQTGEYTLTVHASADRFGGLVGANVNGVLAATANVEMRPFGDYAEYRMTFTASASDTIRVWMYSPGVPGYVVIDDVSLEVTEAAQTISGGSWVVLSSPPPLARFNVTGVDGSFQGRWLYSGNIPAWSVCGYGRTCAPGTLVDLSSEFENLSPGTPPVTEAPGSAVYRGTSYPFLEYGGAVFLTSAIVQLPVPPGLEYPERVRVSAPFVTSGTLSGYEVLGLRDPRHVFATPFTGRGIAHLDLLTGPSPSGPTLTVFMLTYEFQEGTR